MDRLNRCIAVDVYCQTTIWSHMHLLRLHQSLADQTRLRIMHLLMQRPLCVCHLQAVLECSQVLVSQHLRRLKNDGLVDSQRHRSWMIYSVGRGLPSGVQAHLQCLREHGTREDVFRNDLQALKKVRDCDWIESVTAGRVAQTSKQDGQKAKVRPKVRSEESGGISTPQLLRPPVKTGPL